MADDDSNTTQGILGRAKGAVGGLLNRGADLAGKVADPIMDRLDEKVNSTADAIGEKANNMLEPLKPANTTKITPTEESILYEPKEDVTQTDEKPIEVEPAKEGEAATGQPEEDTTGTATQEGAGPEASETATAENNNAEGGGPEADADADADTDDSSDSTQGENDQDNQDQDQALAPGNPQVDMDVGEMEARAARLRAQANWDRTMDSLASFAVTAVPAIPGITAQMAGQAMQSVSRLMNSFFNNGPMSIGSSMLAETLATADTLNKRTGEISDAYGIARDADRKAVEGTIKGKLMYARTEGEKHGMALGMTVLGEYLRQTGKTEDQLDENDIRNLATYLNRHRSRMQEALRKDRAARMAGQVGDDGNVIVGNDADKLDNSTRLQYIGFLRQTGDVLKGLDKRNTQLGAQYGRQAAQAIRQVQDSKRADRAQAELDRQRRYDNANPRQKLAYDIVGMKSDLDMDENGIPISRIHAKKLIGRLDGLIDRYPDHPNVQMWRDYRDDLTKHDYKLTEVQRKRNYNAPWNVEARRRKARRKATSDPLTDEERAQVEEVFGRYGISSPEDLGAILDSIDRKLDEYDEADMTLDDERYQRLQDAMEYFEELGDALGWIPSDEEQSDEDATEVEQPEETTEDVPFDTDHIRQLMSDPDWDPSKVVSEALRGDDTSAKAMEWLKDNGIIVEQRMPDGTPWVKVNDDWKNKLDGLLNPVEEQPEEVTNENSIEEPVDEPVEEATEEGLTDDDRKTLADFTTMELEDIADMLGGLGDDDYFRLTDWLIDNGIVTIDEGGDGISFESDYATLIKAALNDSDESQSDEEARPLEFNLDQNKLDTNIKGYTQDKSLGNNLFQRSKVIKGILKRFYEAEDNDSKYQMWKLLEGIQGVEKERLDNNRKSLWGENKHNTLTKRIDTLLKMSPEDWIKVKSDKDLNPPSKEKKSKEKGLGGKELHKQLTETTYITSDFDDAIKKLNSGKKLSMDDWETIRAGAESNHKGSMFAEAHRILEMSNSERTQKDNERFLKYLVQLGKMETKGKLTEGDLKDLETLREDSQKKLS